MEPWMNGQAIPGMEPWMYQQMGSMSGVPNETKDGKQNNKGKTKDEYVKDAVAYRVYFNTSHNQSHSLGWMIYVFSLVALIVGIGLVGGIWESVPASTRTQSFENYCYSVWAVLGLGIVLATCFIAYFYHTMRQFKLGHEKKFSDLWKK